MKRRRSKQWSHGSGIALLLALMVAVTTTSGAGQQTDTQKTRVGPNEEADPGDTGKLGEAKISRNPLATTIMVPWQFNFNFGLGAQNDLEQLAFNVQPLIPFHLCEGWNLITRTVLPVIRQPEFAPGVGPVFGLGDLSFAAWISPVSRSDLVWGLGPGLAFPTATDPMLGTGKFAAGPSAVAVWVADPWLAGVLLYDVWSYAGDPDRQDVHQMFLQPGVNYGLGHGWYLTSVPMIVADWPLEEKNRWTVPVGGGLGKIIPIYKQPVDLTLQAFYNVVRPEMGPDWQLRFTVNLIFPRSHEKR